MGDEVQSTLGHAARIAYRFFDALSDTEREQVLLALVEVLPQPDAEVAQNALYHLQQQRKAGLALRTRLLPPEDADRPVIDPSRSRPYLGNTGRICVNFDHYLKAIVSELVSPPASGTTVARATVNAPALRLPVEFALPVGIIAHELVADALRRAFPGGRHGRIEVHVTADARRVTLTVADDGVGLPKSHSRDEANQGGWRLIRHLVHHLGATVDSLSRSGTSVTVAFPRTAPAHVDFTPVSLLHAMSFPVLNDGGCTCDTGVCACSSCVRPGAPRPDSLPPPHSPSRHNTS
ncbi:MAG: sensor histidine kinase [Opitutae bacterium]|nr:sensor histidine kinase [Opitutae bacterium]